MTDFIKKALGNLKQIEMKIETKWNEKNGFSAHSQFLLIKNWNKILKFGKNEDKSESEKKNCVNRKNPSIFELF